MQDATETTQLDPQDEAIIAENANEMAADVAETVNALVEQDSLTALNYRQELRTRMIPFHRASAGTVRYQRIPMCGHKFIPSHEPRHRNCEACWFTFFNVHGELSQSCDKVFTELGEGALRQLRGVKFTKNFLKFMSTLAQWKKVADEAKSQTSQ